MTGYTGVKNLPEILTQQRPDRESNQRPVGRKSDPKTSRYLITAIWM